jgi:hypothetical protein
MEQASWERFLAPRALFLGMLLSFAACCVAGQIVARHNYLHDFVRFHKALTPEGLFYPSARQIRAFGRSYLDPNKITVVIGGSSIMHGVGQRVDEVWTRRLQALLGDEYQVVNFGLRAAYTAEFGAAAAEILQHDHPRLLFVADLHPGWMHPDPNGRDYQYFFWDAYCNHLLVPDPVRDGRLTQELAEIERLERTKQLEAWHLPARQQRELRTAMSVDRPLCFMELWNTLAYTCLHTAWTRLVGFQPRWQVKDDEPGARPLESRYAKDDKAIVDYVRGNLNGCYWRPDGEWIEDSASSLWRELDSAATCSFPEAVRPRTLLLVLSVSPHYLDQLAPVERACYTEMSRLTVQHLTQDGLAAVEIGERFAAEDYNDLLHMTSSGGAKMAAAVAPALKAMARRLGYVHEGPVP